MEPVETDEAPAAVGAYSQGTVTDGLVFTAGQIPLTTDGEMVDGTVAEQTERALENVAATAIPRASARVCGSHADRGRESATYASSATAATSNRSPAKSTGGSPRSPVLIATNAPPNSTASSTNSAASR